MVYQRAFALSFSFTSAIAAPVPHPTQPPWLDNAPFQDTETPWKVERQVVIIGAGISGSSVAYHLATDQKESDVSILDARGVAGGASGRNSGGLDASIDWAGIVQTHGKERAEALLRFETEGLAAVERLGRHRCGEACELQIGDQPGYNGSLSFFKSKARFQEAQVAAEAQIKGPEWVGKNLTVLTATECNRRTNATRPGFAGCIASRFAGNAVCAEFVFALVRDFLARGGGLHTRTVVQAIQPVQEQDPRARGFRWEVTTTSARYGTRIVRAKSVVVATNAYTAELLPAWGSRIVPVRGQMIESSPILDARLPFDLGFDAGDTYGHQRPSGELVLGGFRRVGPGQQVGIADDSTIDPSVSASLRRFLPDQFAAVSQASPAFNVTREWTGIMGFSADEKPWIGPLRGSWRTWSGNDAISSSAFDDSDADGVFVIAGFSGGGFKRGFVYGQAVADMVMHDGIAPKWWRALAWYLDAYLPTLNRSVTFHDPIGPADSASVPVAASV